ncbi:MAG: energy transducer TonB [bacterium]
MSGIHTQPGEEFKSRLDNSDKNTVKGFVYSVALHALLLLVYVASNLLGGNDKSPLTSGTRSGIVNLGGFTMPDLGVKNQPTFPHATTPRSTAGIPAAVSEVPKGNVTNPSTENGNAGLPNGTGIGSPGMNSSTNGNHVEGAPKVQTTQVPETDPNEFVYVDAEAIPLRNIQLAVRYPEQARRANVEGVVRYSALVGKDGKVRRVIIEHADYELFSQPVVEALLNILFKPAMRDNEPVETYYNGIVRFKLLR